MDPIKDMPQDIEGAIEMPTLSRELGQNDSHAADSPATLSVQSSMVALRVAHPREGANVQELPPVDRGMGAWLFCAGGFVSEMMVWGFSFRYASFGLILNRLR